MTRAARPRIGPLAVSQWSARDRELLRGNLARADRYLSGEPDAPPMPAILGLFARHSTVGAAWLAFSSTLLEQGVLDAHDRELLILRVGHRTSCAYLWTQHAGMAQAAGLTPERIAAVADTGEAHPWSERDRDLLRAADQLVAGHVIDDPTWERLARHFDDRQLLELTFVVGSYVCLAAVLNSVGLQPGPAAQPGPGIDSQPSRPSPPTPTSARTPTSPLAQKEESHATFPEAAGR
ncbi:4-carboxymuconolactone decarboxylase [Frankia sp. AiPs1]|uniref:carboxymuconolactone decarboxylase family protein n=1 Tax=Frankia sp. AiPa1 TaxID=573492 RepID=UPI00202B8FD9|nr:carboxymuconolactone decarboxylase family protein [Frankia sp. AiPa1]MCL9760058.1 carboxymuconolactone decarboxylase family protein [Frankia sp. AiPa1]